MTAEERTEANRRRGRNNKRKGTKSEHRSMLRHVQSGAFCIRSGGSLGLFDFLAVYPSVLVFIQVKSNRWPGKAEMEAISTFKSPYYGRKIIERWDDYAREPLVREIA